MKISMVCQGDPKFLQQDLLRLSSALPAWASAEISADMSAVKTVMCMLQEDVVPGPADLEAAQECVTGIFESRWPMAGSLLQWPNAKKLMRDVQQA
eukprot:9459093-Pyramimonas_sp.AAC.1